MLGEGEGEEGDEDAVDQGYIHDEFAEADEDESDPNALPPPPPPNTSTFLPNPTAGKSKRPMGSKTPQVRL